MHPLRKFSISKAEWEDSGYSDPKYRYNPDWLD